MPLRPGDSLTLTVSPTIQIAPYQFLKPSASVTRVLTDPVADDVADMEVELRQAVLRSCATELGVLDEISQALEGGIDMLASHCLSQIGKDPKHGTEGSREDDAGTKTERPQGKAREGIKARRRKVS